MTYEEVTKYLFSQLPMYQRDGSVAFKKTSDNIVNLCNYLGNPQDNFKSVHIAGTNGKGSVSHMVAAGIQANGNKVGLYTSPHYKDYRERIKINGQLMSEFYVIDFVTRHKAYFEKLQPSFFEITVAMAFDYFAKEKVDVAVIEVGLGGRLDSTNIIKPLLSVITNISMDHQSMLGNTLPEIAAEKAGIIKDDIPVIIGEYQEEVASVFKEKANLHHSKITFADQEIDFTPLSETTDQICLTVHQDDEPWIPRLCTDLKNSYQIKNLKTALYALYQLKEVLNLEDSKIVEGIENMRHLTYFLGRWMKLNDHPRVIADSAHNEAGVQYLLQQIETIPYQKLRIVWGTVNDKDFTKILAMLPKGATYYFAKADIPRGLDTSILVKESEKLGLNGLEYVSVASAYRVALAEAHPDDLIIIAGSIFVVAEIV